MCFRRCSRSLAQPFWTESVAAGKQYGWVTYLSGIEEEKVRSTRGCSYEQFVKPTKRRWSEGQVDAGLFTWNRRWSEQTRLQHSLTHLKWPETSEISLNQWRKQFCASQVLDHDDIRCGTVLRRAIYEQREEKTGSALFGETVREKIKRYYVYVTD